MEDAIVFPDGECFSCCLDKWTEGVRSIQSKASRMKKNKVRRSGIVAVKEHNENKKIKDDGSLLSSPMRSVVRDNYMVAQYEYLYNNRTHRVTIVTQLDSAKKQCQIAYEVLRGSRRNIVEDKTGIVASIVSPFNGVHRATIPSLFNSTGYETGSYCWATYKDITALLAALQFKNINTDDDIKETLTRTAKITENI